MTITPEQCNALSQTGVPQWNFNATNPCACSNGKLFFNCQEDQITSITLSCVDDKPVKIISALEKIPSLQRLVLNGCNLSEDNPEYLQHAKNIHYIGFTNVKMTPPLPSQLFTEGRFVDFSPPNHSSNLEYLSFRSESPACLHGKSPSDFSCAELIKCGHIQCTDMNEPPYRSSQSSETMDHSSTTTSSSKTSASDSADTKHPSSTQTESVNHQTSALASNTKHQSVDTTSHQSSTPTDSVNHHHTETKDSISHTSSSSDRLPTSSNSPKSSSVADNSYTANLSSSSLDVSSSQASSTTSTRPTFTESKHHSLASKQDIQLVLYGVIGALMMAVCIPGLV